MKRVTILWLAIIMLLHGCGTVQNTSLTEDEENIFSMTKDSLLEYINSCLETYNSDNKYNPVELLELSSIGYKNRYNAYSFHIDEDDGIVRKIYLSYFGNNGTFNSGMNALEGYWVYLSILINLYAGEDAGSVGRDAEEFYNSRAKSGEIKADNGVAFSWANFSTSKYYYTTTITIPSPPLPDHEI